MLTPPLTEVQVPVAERHAWIAEAAYYRAKRRGFQGDSKNTKATRGDGAG